MGGAVGFGTSLELGLSKNAQAKNTTQCFVAGTLITTDGALIPIESVRVGDYVWAANPDTGEVVLKKVVQVFVNQADELVHLTVSGEKIICTNEHPFYSPVKGWIAACKLRAGDILVTVNGEYVVVEKIQHEILEAPVTVYNFEVEGFHTYYVSSACILVHNKCADNYNARDNIGTSRAPKQGYPDSTYTQISSDNKGTIVSQTTYNEYHMPGQRIDYLHSHGAIKGPHVHRYSYVVINGNVYQNGKTVEQWF